MENVHVNKKQALSKKTKNERRIKMINLSRIRIHLEKELCNTTELAN